MVFLGHCARSCEHTGKNCNVSGEITLNVEILLQLFNSNYFMFKFPLVHSLAGETFSMLSISKKTSIMVDLNTDKGHFMNLVWYVKPQPIFPVHGKLCWR